MATVPVLSLPTAKNTIHKYFFFHVVSLNSAHPTVCMTYLCLLSYSSCTEVAVESSCVSLLKLVGFVVHLEVVKTGTVLTVFLPRGDGISRLRRVSSPPAPLVLLS